MRTQHLITFVLLSAGALACDPDPVAPAERGDAPALNPAAPNPSAPNPTGLKAQREATADASPAAKPENDDRDAEATFKSVPGVELKGEAELEETDAGLRIEVDVKSAPVGLKGIHVHEKGDCSNIPGKSMGAHFSPGAETHGLPEAHVKHLGDLGNIEIAANGDGKLEIVVAHANLKPGDAHSFLGKAIVIHTAKDVGTGESGESGDPIACAVIEKD